MAITQIRDIAFVATEPQNKYNLWLHFKEKKALVLEMWVNGAWREVNSFWGTEGDVDPEPVPVPPEPQIDYTSDFSETDSESPNYIRNNPIVTIKLSYLGNTIYEDTRTIPLEPSKVVRGEFPISAKRFMRAPDKVIINGNDLGQLSVKDIITEILKYVNNKAIIVLEVEKFSINPYLDISVNTNINKYIIDYNNYTIDNNEETNSSLHILFKRLNSRNGYNSIVPAFNFTDELDSSELTGYDLARFNSYSALNDEWVEFCIEHHEVVPAGSSTPIITTDYLMYTLVANLNEPVIYTPKVSVPSEISGESVQCTVEGYVEPYITDIYKNIRLYYEVSDTEIENWQPVVSSINPSVPVTDNILINVAGNYKESITVELSQEEGEHTIYLYTAIVVWIDRSISSGTLDPGQVYKYMKKVIPEVTTITYTVE